MSVTDQASSGATTDQTSGAPVEDDNSHVDSRSIDPKDHQRALEDLHKYKKSAKDLSKQISELTAQIESVKTEKLREKEDWKTLAEQEKKRAEEVQAKLAKMSEAYTYTQKYSSIHAAALKAGLRQEAESDLSLIPMDDVEVEVTSEGRFLVHGADAFVEKQKKLRPHWFKSDAPPVINGGGGRGAIGNSGSVSATDLYQLERKHGRQSPEYQNALKQWQEQRKKVLK